MDYCKKDSFILYTEQTELFNELTNEDAGKLIKGIFRYVKTGESPVFEGITKMAFIPIRQMLDRNAEKYEEKREKLSQNGKKGGRPRIITADSEMVEQQSLKDTAAESENTDRSSLKNKILSRVPFFKKTGKLRSKDTVELAPVDFMEITQRASPKFYEEYLKRKKGLTENTE